MPALRVNLSASNLLPPSVDVGFVALSVLIKTNFPTSSIIYASSILLVPTTLVLTASKGLSAQISICFRAAV